jgi:hypothetical protein
MTDWCWFGILVRAGSAALYWI